MSPSAAAHSASVGSVAAAWWSRHGRLGHLLDRQLDGGDDRPGQVRRPLDPAPAQGRQVVVELDDDAGTDDGRLAHQGGPRLVGGRFGGDEEPPAGRAAHRLLHAADLVVAGDGDQRVALDRTVPDTERGAGREQVIGRAVAGERPHHGRLDDDGVDGPRPVLDDVHERRPAQWGVRPDRPHAGVVAREQRREQVQGQACPGPVVVEVGDETLPSGVGLDGRGDRQHLGVFEGEAGVVGQRAEGRRLGERRREPLPGGDDRPIGGGEDRRRVVPGLALGDGTLDQGVGMGRPREERRGPPVIVR